MIKLLVAAGGILILIGAVWGLKSLKTSETEALARDQDKHAFAVADPDMPLPCHWKASLPERVVAENKSEALEVEVTNPYLEKCQSTLSLRAPGFDTAPVKEEQQITLPASMSGSLAWVMTPRKTGSFDVTVSDVFNTKVFGVTVKNVFGLTTGQAKVASGIGTLFGPMLTVPWWWDRLRRKSSSA